MPYFWLLAINPKFNNFLWVCWFLCKNLSNFVPPAWKLHCHILHQLTRALWLDIRNVKLVRKYFHCFLIITYQLWILGNDNRIWCVQKIWIDYMRKICFSRCTLLNKLNECSSQSYDLIVQTLESNFMIKNDQV